MKKLIAVIFVSFLFSSTPSVAVEFGHDATGDANAVKVGGSSGFLYSERIVITVGHVIEWSGGVDRWEKNGVVYKPGIASIAGQKPYRVKKVLIPSTYITPDYANNLIYDDLAILILSEDIPITKKAVLATEDQMKRFVREKSKVELVGYGMTSGSGRNRPWEEIINRAPNKLTSTLISPEAVIEFYKQYPSVDWKKINKPGVYGIVQHRELQKSSICDGDSGSVFFVEEDSVRYVLGTTGLGLINNNCPPPERSYPFPSMSWIDPKSKLSDLIKIAEKIVNEDKKREFAQAEEIRIATELQEKQEAEKQAKAKAEADTIALEKAKSLAEAETLVLAQQLAKAELVATIKKNQDMARKLYAGKKCNKLRSTKSVAELKFTCIKKNNRLVWNRGILINN
jgi:hypothetical protein